MTVGMMTLSNLQLDINPDMAIQQQTLRHRAAVKKLNYIIPNYQNASRRVF